MVQGPLVKWSVESPDGPHPPTAVLIHGILGSRRNLLSFAKRLSQTFPSWQFLLVDLRCHGQTANMEQPPEGPNNVVWVNAWEGRGESTTQRTLRTTMLRANIFFFNRVPRVIRYSSRVKNECRENKTIREKWST